MTTSKILSKREAEVLQLLVLGLSQRKIADILRLHHGSIQVYKSRALNKMGAENTNQAFLKALKLGEVRQIDWYRQDQLVLELLIKKDFNVLTSYLLD